MDYHGLFPKFKFKRPLKEDEVSHRLRQLHREELNGKSVTSDAALIKMNSSFIELVDKYYYPKGMCFFIGLPGFFGLSYCMFIFMWHYIIDGGWVDYTDALPYYLLIIPGWGTVAVLFIVLKREVFCWTHYPIRFDRKNRMVHIFRFDGTTRSVAWESVFFTTGLSHSKGLSGFYYISGHILSSDNKTVIDSFCLPATSDDRVELLRHWEFVRRYMEEGPGSVISKIDFCLPIDKKRESFSFGFLYLLSGFNGAPIILLPFFLALMSIFCIPRFIAIRTSKIPVWPQEIEKMCQFDKDDPYIKDQTMNSPHPWRDIFTGDKNNDSDHKG